MSGLIDEGQKGVLRREQREKMLRRIARPSTVEYIVRRSRSNTGGSKKEDRSGYPKPAGEVLKADRP